MGSFPSQKIATSKKDKKWRVDCVDSIIDDSVQEYYTDVRRMLDAYKLVNSQLDQDDYRAVCRNLGVSEEHGKKYVQAYNKTHNVYSTLKGEESSRPFNFRVINLSPNASNEFLQKEDLDMMRYIETVYKRRAEVVQKEIELEKKVKAGEMDPNTMDRQMAAFEDELSKKYKNILDLDKIKARYQNKLTQKENTVNKLLKIMVYKNRIKWLKNETFGDAIVAGKEVVEVRFNRDQSLPTLRQLNPLNIFYHKSPDTPFIHESDYAGYREWMTVGQVLDLYGDKMHPKDIDKLQTFDYEDGGAYGTSDSLYRKPSDPAHASSWAAKQAAGLYPSGDDIDPYASMIAEGKHMAVPHGGSKGSRVVGPGLYADEQSSNDDYITVYTVYWKSYRKVGKYTYVNEYGKLSEEIVDEEFVIPDGAKRETYQENMFSRKKTKYVWYDSDGNYNSYEDYWIAEIWKGTRINGDIYLDIEPLEHAYQSLLSPYEVRLPIYGYVYNSRNSGTVSVIDRLMPWQKLYYVVMSKVLRMLAQDKGVLTFLNTLMIDKDFGVKRTLQMAEDQGLIPYNPLAYSKGGQFVNTLKVAERVDATNAESMQYYLRLLEFIESNLEEAAGMSPQRLAQASPNRTASDNQRQTAHSMNITEPLFSAHETLWEQIMQGYLEMTVSSLNEATGKIRGFLNDEEIAVLDMGLISLEDEYLLRFANNSKNHEILQQGYQLVHALIQNDKAHLSTLISLMQTDDINEFKRELKVIEDEIVKREQAFQESRQKSEEERQHREMLLREDLQKARLDEIYLKGKLDQVQEHIRGKYMITSFNMKSDADNSGELDLMEKQHQYERFLHEIAKDKTEAELRQQELEQRKIEHADNVAKDVNKDSMDQESKNLDRDAEIMKKMQELRTKERIENSKKAKESE